MDREEALSLVKNYVQNENLIKHMFAVEAVMEDLAKYFDQDIEKWALAGLVHDIDYDLTADRPKEHALKGAEILSENGVDEEIIHAVKAHNPVHGPERKSLMDKALYAVDPLTGLIVAAALIHPDKKLSSLDTQFIINRFGEKSFARGADRDQIRACSELDLELEEFIEISLKAMQRISNKLGL